MSRTTTFQHLLAAGRMVVSGSLSLGAFFTFNLLLAMLVMPLRMLGMWIGQAQRAIAAGERIFEILDEPEEVADAPDAHVLPPGPGDVVFEDVSFGYDPERLVLDGIELRIPAGRTVALIGRTGSGKTTLATLVPRFYDVGSGRVVVDGIDVRKLVRDLLAFGSDVPHLSPLGKALLVGPGSILDAHTDRERVSLSDLRNSVDAYERLAVRLLEEKP